MRDRFTTRRALLSAMGGAAFALGQDKPQTQPDRVTPDSEADRNRKRVRPAVCAYSGCFAKIPYSELPDIIRTMGYDGIDLTVMPGGHVDPSKYMVEMDRAFQTFQDAGIETPMVTTSFISPSEPYAYAIFYVSGELGARLIRLGTWPALPVATNAGPAASQFVQMRATMLRNDLTQFAATGQRCNVTPLLANHAGSFPGRSIPEVEAMLASVPPKLFQYCFDPAQAVIEAKSANGWEAAVQAALPRLGAVAISDVGPDKNDSNAMKPCAMGEGVIDWKKFFSILAGARFHGPVSLHRDYETNSEVSALRRDLAFVRARVDEAWPLPATN